MRISLMMAILAATIISCTKKATEEPTETLIFQSGFEPNTTGVPDEAIEIFTGTDASKATNSSWDNLNEHPNIGQFNIQYEGGNTRQRFAQLVPDPTNADNTVLAFWLDSANVTNDQGQYYKGRIQANVYQNTGLTELYIKVRMYLHPDINLLKNADPANDWLTLFEFWNNAPWLDPANPFRITINLVKDNTGPVTDLYFGVHGQIRVTEKKWENQWNEVNTAIGAPIGQWVTTEIYFKEGDQNLGKFKFVVTPQGGSPVTVFDITNSTHHPNGPDENGLSEFNPMKLYTSKGVIDYIRSQNGTLQVYWDDFELWKSKKL